MLPRSTLAIVKSLPGMARDANGEPILSGETIGIDLLPRKDGTGNVNVTVRGIQASGFDLRPDLKLVSGAGLTRACGNWWYASRCSGVFPKPVKAIASTLAKATGTS